MKIKLTILGLVIAVSATANIQLPWDSLFASYGLSKKATTLPIHITAEWDLQYNNGHSAGIWGLTPPVALKYGLTINEKKDERYDLRLSTNVAAKYLKDLVEYYGNEDVAILAYLNGAPLLTDIAKMYDINLKEVTEQDIETLCKHLPKNGICDTIKYDHVSFLDSLYNYTGYIKCRFKYPIRKTTLQDSIGVILGKINTTILPSARWIEEVFVPETLNIEEILDTIYEAEIAAREEELTLIAQQDMEREKARAAAIKKANEVQIYIVKSGDTLGHIAKRHKVTVTQLKKWNGLKSDFLRIGQKIKIHN